MVSDVNKIGTYENWEKNYAEFSKGIKLDKIYLETYRDDQYVNDDAMKAAIKFFKDKGVEVAGGITYNYAGGKRQRWESFCYTNPEHIAIIKKVAQLTAKYFDEIVLDDYYFTNCKCQNCVEAKGDKSWGEFRRDLLDKVAKEDIVKAAKEVNPNCKVIVKYPNWYDHFHGLGFDLDRGPYTFDGVYTGNETRDPAGEQHLQCYESFAIGRYFDSLRPGHNFGGWIDNGGVTYLNRFKEQLWFTLFSKLPELIIWNYGSMGRPITGLGEDGSRTWGALSKEAYDEVDPILSKLGTPKGIKAYKPFQSEGEDFLHNYMGMAGVPVEIVSKFPTDDNIVILTECAKYDPNILQEMKDFMKKGGDVIVTSGFYRAMQDKGIKNIFEMTVTTRSADIDTCITSKGWSQIAMPTDVPVRIPVTMYHTNDSWEMVTGMSYGNGWPLLHHSVYSNGNIFVWVIPDNFSHLYALPANALNQIRTVASRDMDVRLEGPSRVALLTYDNKTFVVHNFRDTPTEVTIVVKGEYGITDLATNKTLSGYRDVNDKVVDRPIVNVSKVKVTIAPHTFQAYSIKQH